MIYSINVTIGTEQVGQYVREWHLARQSITTFRFAPVTESDLIRTDTCETLKASLVQVSFSAFIGIIIVIVILSLRSVIA